MPRKDYLTKAAQYSLLCISLSDVISLVPVGDYEATNKLAAATPGDRAMAATWLDTMSRHAVRAVLRLREERIRARAIVTNEATRYRHRAARARRPASRRARRTRATRGATRAGPRTHGDGEPPERCSSIVHRRREPIDVYRKRVIWRATGEVELTFRRTHGALHWCLRLEAQAREKSSWTASGPADCCEGDQRHLPRGIRARDQGFPRSAAS